MRKKSQPWLVPLLILIAVLWAMGKKDTPPSPAKPNPPPPANTLVSAPLPETLPLQTQLINQYVNADKLNIRSQPAGKVIASMKRGDKVQVFERKDDWVRISADGQPAKWLSSKSLCDAVNCYGISRPETTRPARLSPQPTVVV